MNHDHLRILVEIAQQGSFSSVAKLHDLDPSSVSRMVQSVERELGVRLFQRSTRHVALTEAGNAYLTRVSYLLEELDSASEALKSLEQHPAGTLRVTASVAFGQTCLVPLMPEFASLYPDILMELIFTDANLDMVSDRIDLALRLSPRMAQDMVRVKWFNASYKLCASPGYLIRHGAIRKPSDLIDHRCVLFGHPHPQSNWLVHCSSGAIENVSVPAAMTASNGLAQRELALAGVGPALMPTWLSASNIASGQLVDILPDYTITPGDFEGAAWLLYPSRTFLPAKTRAIVDFLLSRTQPQWIAAQRPSTANRSST
ncbi:LysR family transcriptional regulator [Paraburkholderia sediminicola]|uniref:LysR family transcriptional regulator n=1 Tax=Paraburkholderia metrosideri TaxID=580937 RepID=A0ABW9E068_9BURK